MNPLNILRSLIAMALVDGHLSDEELAILNERRAAWNVSEQDFAEAVEEAKTATGYSQLPTAPHQRYDLLYDLIIVMAADGKIDPREAQLLATAAARLEVPQSELEQMLDEILGDDELVLGDPS